MTYPQSFIWILFNFFLLFGQNSVFGAPASSSTGDGSSKDLNRQQRSPSSYNYPVVPATIMEKETGRIIESPDMEMANFYPQYQDYSPAIYYQYKQPQRFFYPGLYQQQPDQLEAMMRYHNGVPVPAVPAKPYGNGMPEFEHLENKRSSGYMCHFKLCQMGASGKRRFMNPSAIDSSLD